VSIFTRKPRLVHQLVATQVDHGIVYACSVCTRGFYSVKSATEGNEYCCGKHCYVEFTFDKIPAHLKTEEQIKDSGRTIGKGQQPLAYKHYELIGTMIGPRPIKYYALYDMRECLELDDAIPLPDLE
jgi:hypothetical protein